MAFEIVCLGRRKPGIQTKSNPPDCQGVKNADLNIQTLIVGTFNAIVIDYLRLCNYLINLELHSVLTCKIIH